MIANVDGKEVRVYKENGTIVRVIYASAPAVSAYVSGDRVNIQLENGRSEIYKTDGTPIRRF